MDRTKGRVLSSITETTIDENGEVQTLTNYVTSRMAKEPPYIKMYLDTIMYLNDLPKGHSRVLLAFLQKMTYASDEDAMCIYVNAPMKRGIAKNLDISVSHVNNVLQDLVKGEIFYRIERGYFQVNPYLFGKGEWKDIDKIRMQIVFDANGKSVKTEIEKNTKKRT